MLTSSWGRVFASSSLCLGETPAAPARHDTSQYDTSEYDTSEYDTSEYDTSEYDTSQYDTSEYDTSQYDTSEYDTSQYDTSEYDTCQYDTLPGAVALHMIQSPVAICLRMSTTSTKSPRRLRREL